MDKGLLMKEDAIRRQSLIDRGLASLKNLIPKTGLERSLLSNLTSGKMFDLKGMATGALRNMALKKLGLGFLNPFLGIASLFGFNPLKGITSRFAQKPVDMSAFNKLGLYADRFPTATDTMSTLTARGPRTTAEKIATGETDLAKLITGEKQDTSGIEELRLAKADPTLPGMSNLPSGYPWSVQGEGASPTSWITKVAHGGFIDRPLMGRSRDI